MVFFCASHDDDRDPRIDKLNQRGDQEWSTSIRCAGRVCEVKSFYYIVAIAYSIYNKCGHHFPLNIIDRLLDIISTTTRN